ncbi:MAG: carbohydrate ABC transporter permease [Hyphomicrobiales bacterium]
MTSLSLLVLLLLVSLVPFLWLVVSSFKSSIELYERPFSLPSAWSLENYVMAFTQQPMLAYLVNSVIAALGSTLLAVAMAAMASYSLLGRWRMPAWMAGFLTFGLFLPTSAFIVPYFFIDHWIGLYDSVFGLVIVYAGVSLPLAFMIVKAFMETIPGAIIDAAVVDGAGFNTIFWRVVLPMTKPGLATACIFLIIVAWNELLLANLLTGSDAAKTVQVGILSFLEAYHAQYTVAFAGIVVTVVPIMAIYLLLSRYIVAGLQSGAVKYG